PGRLFAEGPNRELGSWFAYGLHLEPLIGWRPTLRRPLRERCSHGRHQPGLAEPLLCLSRLPNRHRDPAAGVLARRAIHQPRNRTAPDRLGDALIVVPGRLVRALD